jgi:hypothetical protein
MWRLPYQSQFSGSARLLFSGSSANHRQRTNRSLAVKSRAEGFETCWTGNLARQ